MATKLYVGNLPYSFTEGDLEKLIAECGAVDSARLILDRATGRSKGFGFVEMENEDDANNAISELNGKEIEGRAIVVNEARPPAPRRGGGGFGGGGGGGGRGGRGGGGGRRGGGRGRGDY